MGEPLPRCAAAGCTRRARTGGLCAMHHWRQSEWLVEAGEIVAPDEAPQDCSINGCARPRMAKGLCRMHYGRKRRGVENWDNPEPHKPGPKAKPPRACSVKDCGRQSSSHELCPTHFVRKRSGDPSWDDPIPRPRPEPQRKKRRPGPVPPEIASELRADYAMARRVNGVTPQDSPDRDANQRFNDRIVALLSAGHTHAQIAEAAGATAHMVSGRIRKIKLALGLTQPPPCSIDGCDRPVYATGVCLLHYSRRLAGKASWAGPGTRSMPGERTMELCANGHPRTPNNLSVTANGSKRCKACKREAQRRSVVNQRQEITEDMHGGATAYRYGCRCPKCRRFHSQESQQRRWMERFGPGGTMGPEVRDRVLDALRRTGSVKESAEEVGVKHQAIYGAARAVPGFGILVDQLTAGRPTGRDG